MKECQAKLLVTINSLEDPRRFQRLFMYYDRETDDAELPTVVTEWDGTARKFSHVLC